jgi:SHS family lactate transporter-like MFS transporter
VGFFSGILQQGYALGYLIAVVFYLYVVPNSRYSWKSLFCIGAGLTAAVAIARLFFPESKQFIEAKQSGGQITGRKKARLS